MARGKGNDKGKVEGIVGYCRRNFLVPMPRFRNFDDLNTHLEACCAKRWAEQLRGHDQTVGERLEREGGSAMSDTPQLLLAHHLKALKLPTFLREYDKQARQCAAEGVDHVRYLVRLTELELIDRERRMVERRIRMAKFNLQEN